MSKDYYKILGVEKNASKEDIKKAFRKLAHQYHPDKTKGDDSKFKEVNEAYQTLSDDQKRAQYDQFSAGGGYGGGQGFGGFSAGGGPASGWDFSGAQGFDMGDLGDIFGDFFGGGMGGRRNQSRRGRDISTEIDISFEDAMFGITRKILITKQSKCDSCNGTGAKMNTKMDTCKSCNGQGQVREIRRSILGTFQTTKVCDKCSGEGKTPKEYCKDCSGHGVLNKQTEIEIKIPKGIDNGEMIKMNGMGEAVKGAISGDLYIKINVKPHNIFKRDGYNLYTDISINLSDAILGVRYELKTFDGVVDIKIPEGTNHKDLLRIKGKGVPNNRERGDIIVRVLVRMPNKISKKARKLIEDLKSEGI